ncbi:MAG: SPFH domain-containing protein [Pseudomonadota bacterium]
MVGYSNVALLLVFLAVCVVFMGIKQVPQGFQWTVERFGRYITTLKPGLNLIMPFVDRVGHKLNMKEQVLDIPSQEVISRDNAMVRVDAVCFYQIVDAARAAYEISQLDYSIRNLIMTNIRTVLGGLDLDGALSQRDHINSRLLSVVDEATSPWGIKVTRIEIKDISPPKELVSAMAEQMKAERSKRAQILDAEGSRQAEITRAEGKKLAAILESEGLKEATFRAAEARERSAAAEARANQLVSDSIRDGEPLAIQYFIAQQYIEALGKLASADNQKVLMLPLETTQMLGALQGMSELFRASSGTNTTPTTSTHGIGKNL